jgi:hypothetical protein
MLDVDQHIQVLERLLDRCNQMQGLGFVLGENGKVLDRKTLRTLFMAVASLLFTVVPVMLALRPPSDPGPPPVYVSGTDIATASPTDTGKTDSSPVVYVLQATTSSSRQASSCPCPTMSETTNARKCTAPAEG